MKKNNKYYIGRKEINNKQLFKGKLYTFVEEVELTEDDYGLILDALYEQAALQESCIMLSGRSGSKISSAYSQECRKVAKKFEKIFGEDKVPIRKLIMMKLGGY